MAQQKKLFRIDQAVEFVLELLSDSEISDTRHDDDVDYILPGIQDELEENQNSNNQAENDDQTADKNVNEGQNKNSHSGE